LISRQKKRVSARSRYPLDSTKLLQRDFYIRDRFSGFRVEETHGVSRIALSLTHFYQYGVFTLFQFELELLRICLERTADRIDCTAQRGVHPALVAVITADTEYDFAFTVAYHLAEYIICNAVDIFQIGQFFKNRLGKSGGKLHRPPLEQQLLFIRFAVEPYGTFQRTVFS